MSDIAEKLAGTGKWHIDTARLSERAGHKCEYCDIDFFGSVFAYKSFQIDHIVPLSKGGEDVIWNKAVACKTCNVDLKSRWNPRERTDSTNREELISVVREYIKERRSFYEKEIEMMKGLAGKTQ